MAVDQLLCRFLDNQFFIFYFSINIILFNYLYLTLINQSFEYYLFDLY
jgi:hypothetical protein